MMKIRTITYILLLLVSVSLASCVRDEVKPCPPLQVTLVVKDKNYFNVNKVASEERKSEDLAFREYIPTLYCVLRDADTGKIMEEQGVFEVTGDDKTFTLTFCDCIPHGKYILTVWGGLKDNTSLGDDPLTAMLHAENQEATDVYMTNDVLVYDAWNNNQTVDMERVMGKLIVEVENLLYDVNYSDKTVGGLFKNVDNEFKYIESTSVYTQNEWKYSPAIVTKTLLAPSQIEKGSAVHINFYDRPDRTSPRLTPKDVNITMKRNELTVLKYVYDDGEKDFLIYILVNDEWEVLHNMDID